MNKTAFLASLTTRQPGRCACAVLLVLLTLMQQAIMPTAQALPVARFKRVQPLVQVRDGQKPFVAARARQALFFGNIVRTGPSGKADILFSNGTQLAMRSNSQIEIVTNETASSPLVIRVIGALSEVFVRPRGNTQVRTMAAIAAARGTEFLVSLPTEDSTVVTVSEGSVDFSNERGAVLVEVGQQSSATTTTPPTPPRAVDVTGLLEWTADITQLPITFEATPQTPAAVRAALEQIEGGAEAAARDALQTLANATGPENAVSGAAAQTLLGVLALRDGQLAAAGQAFQSAMERDRTASSPRALQALLHLNDNRIADALPLAREATTLQPGSALAQNALALVLFFKGDTREAGRAARRAGEIDPLSPLTLLVQGRVALGRGQLDEARQNFAQASALFPQLPLARIELGTANRQLDRLPQAEKEFRAALKLSPNSTDAKIGLARTLQQRGQSAEATAIYQEVLAAQPNNTSARGAYAQLLIEEGRLTEARAEIERGIGDDPESGQLLIRASEEALYRQDLFAAQEYARRAVGLFPNSAPARYQLGRVFLEQERVIQAEQEFRQAVTLDPNLAVARYALGLARERTGLGLLAGASSQFGNSMLGSPGSGQSLQNLQSPGAEERLQAAAQDPTVIRVATRSFGDTQIDGAIGPDDTHDLALSHLTTGKDRRGLFGVNVERRSTDSERVNGDQTYERAGLIIGRKAKNSPSSFMILGEFERRNQGVDVLRESDPFRQSIRYKSEQPRLIAALNLQKSQHNRTRVLLQTSRTEQGTIDRALPGEFANIDFDSTSGELRHDRQIGERNFFSAGVSIGTRKRNTENRTLTPLNQQRTSDIAVRTQAAYIRNEFRLHSRLRVTGEMQIQKLDYSTRTERIIPPRPPSSPTVRRPSVCPT